MGKVYGASCSRAAGPPAGLHARLPARDLRTPRLSSKPRPVTFAPAGAAASSRLPDDCSGGLSPGGGGSGNKGRARPQGLFSITCLPLFKRPPPSLTTFP